MRNLEPLAQVRSAYAQHPTSKTIIDYRFVDVKMESVYSCTKNLVFLYLQGRLGYVLGRPFYVLSFTQRERKKHRPIWTVLFAFPP